MPSKVAGRRGVTGKSLAYYKTGPKQGIECPFCTTRIVEDFDSHMASVHPDFWRVYLAVIEVKAYGWPKL